MLSRRAIVAGTAAIIGSSAIDRVQAQAIQGAIASDRVFICNEDSNTLSVIDPTTNTVSDTVNVTSFDEDPRPPFRLVTGGVTPTQR
jgi:YVTN family beta-propeller protein